MGYPKIEKFKIPPCPLARNRKPKHNLEIEKEIYDLAYKNYGYDRYLENRIDKLESKVHKFNIGIIFISLSVVLLYIINLL